MQLVSQSIPAVGALLALAARALLPAGGSDSEPRPASDGEPNRGLRTDVRYHTFGMSNDAIPTNMVLVPGGSFTMGVPEEMLRKLFDNSDNRQAGEHLVAMYPEHVEQAADLLVDKFEVSNLQFKYWLDAHGLAPSETLIKFNWITFKNGKPVEGLPEGQEHHPIRAVSYTDSSACARWLGKRLPSEIEWEYVGRRGLKKDQVYPWGSGFEAWDRTKCANAAMNVRSSQGQQSFKPASFKEDCSVDGVFDLCGNVAEWTSSPFVHYPGFQPLDIKDNRGRKTLRGLFSEDQMVYRGGNYLEGNHLTNNLAFRKGHEPGSIVEVIGFRCVMSAQPGLDQLKDAEKTLTLLGDVKGKLEYTPDGIVAELVQYVDPDQNVGRGSKYFAFTRVTGIPSPILKVENDSVEKPMLLAVFTTSIPVADPPLPAGSYGVYFKGKGLTEAEKKAKAEADAAAKKPKGGEAGGEKGRKAGDKRGEGGAKKGGKDGKDDQDSGSKPADGKDGPKDGEGAPEGEKTGAPAYAGDEDKKAPESTEPEKPTTVSLVQVPSDINVLLLKNEAGAIVGWREAKYDEWSMHATHFTYVPGGVDGKQAAFAPGTAAPPSAPRDIATIVFPVKIGTSNRFPRFELKLAFEAGSFEPVRPPALPMPQPPPKRR
jgi:formylglycine-generating enzyme required for sulfatase activity